MERGQKYMASLIFFPFILPPGTKMNQNQWKGSLGNASYRGWLPVVPSRAGKDRGVDLRTNKPLTGMTHKAGIPDSQFADGYLLKNLQV